MIHKHPNTYLLILIILLAVLAVFITGISTDLSLGDEVYQYRFARLWYESGVRPIFDPLLETSSQCLYFFDSDPLWAMGLIGLWSIFGESRTVLQLYQALWFGLMILATYYLGKKVFDQKVGLIAALIAASMPFLIAYSVMGYIDVPGTALFTLGLALLLDRRYLWAGLVVGLSFITKRNTWLFIAPLGGYFLWLLWKKQISVKRILLFVIPAGLVSIPDLIYRNFIWGNIFFYPECSPEMAQVALRAGTPAEVVSTLIAYISSHRDLPIAAISKRFSYNAAQWSWTPSNIFYNPLSIPQYLGIVLIILLLLYVIFRTEKKKDFILLAGVGVYFLEFLVLFKGQWAVRYLAPILGLLSVLAAVVFSDFIRRFRPLLAKIISGLLILACVIQFGATIAYTFYQRRLSPGVLEGYAYIQNNLPINTRIFYPEYSLSEETGHPMIWIRLNELPYIFWKADSQETKELFGKYDTSYIMIKKDRIYDDSAVKHRLGYPQTFIDKLNSYPIFRKIYENQEVEIWEILPK